MLTYEFRVVRINNSLSEINNVPVLIIINDLSDFKIIPISLSNDVPINNISNKRINELRAIIEEEVIRHLTSLKDLTHYNIINPEADNVFNLSEVSYIKCRSSNEAGELIYEKIKV